MDNEETYLQSLINKRKIVRNYVESKKNYPELKTITKYAIKIPTAGFSRGIEIIHVSEKQNIELLAKYSNEDIYVEKGYEKWISKSVSLFLIIINVDAYHKRYNEIDKITSKKSTDWETPYWYVDAGAAMMNCMLLIEEAGLRSGFLGSHNMSNDKIKKHLSIPDEYILLGFITAGVENESKNNTKTRKKRKIVHNEYFSK
jgi:nitroreductase